MRKMFLRSMKTLALAAALLATADATAANEIGQPVTEFTDAEWMKLDWPYKLEGTTRTLLRTELLSFKISAPKAGKYAVEYLVNVTGNNVQLAATASDSPVAVDEPDFGVFAHATTVTDEDLPEPADPAEPVEGEEVAEVAEPFVPADPVCMYSAVELKEGINYVHVWMHIYWRNDALAPQKVQFRSIRLLPEGSGDVAAVAARASQKAFRVKYFTSLQDATTATMVSDYEALVKAIQTDYTTADTTAVVADMTAAALKEQAVRHGKGVIVGQDSTRIDLLLYHNEYSDPTTLAPLGGYDESGSYEMETGMEDYPAQVEFTRYNYFTYKFTAADNLPEGGSWYIQYLASSQNNASIDMTILADDSTTVVMPTYKLSTNNNAWQNYEPMDKRDVAKFQLEAGKTYYLHMYYKEYTNVRDILVRYTPREYHSAEQLEELMEEAQAKLWFYREGTDEYYAVEDRTLLDRLQVAVDLAEDVVYSEDPERVDEAYETLSDAMIALQALKVLNILPTENFDVTAYDESRNCGSKTDGEGIWQLDNFRSGGYMVYKVYNKTDAEYQVDFEFAHAGDGAQLQFQVYVNEDGNDFICADATTEQFASTGGWQVFEPKTLKVGAIPAGYVYLKIAGEGNGQTYVGNPRLFKFVAIPGTEGAGAQALEAAKEAYFALYTAENLQALIDRAREEAAVYSYPEYDQTQVNQLNAVIEQATEALAAEVNVRAAVYKSLEASIANLVNSKKINWQTIPTNEENPFSLNAGVFSKWQMEGGGNIGYAYAEGSVLYYVNVTEADTYDMTLNVSTPGTGAQLRITVTNEDDSELFNQVLDVPNTGGWGNKEDIKTTMTLPEGRVKLLIYGEQAGDNNFVCNTHVISFTKADPTGIDDVQRSMNDAPAIYDLLGRKVNAVKKGLYIINGKKVIVK